MASGQLQKEHYAYKKNGSCALLAAIEPLTGQRIAEVYNQRTKLEFTQFCQLLDQKYKDADQIVLVLDNLNTHRPGAFYDFLPADEAWMLAQKIEFQFTPKSASWLNMIEIEFSALSRQCLNRRISTIGQLSNEVIAYFKEDKKVDKWIYLYENQIVQRDHSQESPEEVLFKKNKL